MGERWRVGEKRRGCLLHHLPARETSSGRGKMRWDIAALAHGLPFGERRGGKKRKEKERKRGVRVIISISSFGAVEGKN